MATEFVCFKVKDSFTPDCCERSIAKFRSLGVEGFDSFGPWGRGADEPLLIYWFQHWESLEAHEKFKGHPEYPAFVQTVTDYASGEPAIYHAFLKPFPPLKVQESPVVEILSLVRQASVDKEKGEAQIEEFIQAIWKKPGYHAYAHGLKHEDPNVHILLVGWDSLEAPYQAYEGSVANSILFKEIFDGAATSAVFVKLHHT